MGKYDMIEAACILATASARVRDNHAGAFDDLFHAVRTEAERAGFTATVDGGPVLRVAWLDGGCIFKAGPGLSATVSALGTSDKTVIEFEFDPTTKTIVSTATDDAVVVAPGQRRPRRSAAAVLAEHIDHIAKEFAKRRSK